MSGWRPPLGSQEDRLLRELTEHDEYLRAKEGPLVRFSMLTGRGGPRGWKWSGILGWIARRLGGKT